MTLRTDFKDEILQPGEEFRIYDIVKGSQVLNSDIHLVKKYNPKQEGDRYGAKEINELNRTVNGLAPMNLLINGDFQINQRGQTEYNNLKANEYFVDMWRMHQASAGKSIKVVSNGIQLIGTDIIIVQGLDGNLINQDLTVKISVDDIECDAINFNLTGAGYNLKSLVQNGIKIGEVGMQSIYDRPVTNIEIKVNKTNSIINYADLFEGDIEYPHFIENSTLAMLRCRTLVKPIEISLSGYNERGADVEFPMTINFDVEFKNTPTYKLIQQGDEVNMKRSVIDRLDRKAMVFHIESSQSGFVRLRNRKYILSCEPL